MKLIRLPYVPPPTRKNKNKIKYNYKRNIACGVQMRGDNGDIPTIIYCGAPMQLIADATDVLKQLLNGNIGDIIIHHEYACRYRIGKVFNRVTVTFVDYNQSLFSFDNLMLLLNKKISTICYCDITVMSLKKILNV